jgi:hypothetical protein
VGADHVSDAPRLKALEDQNGKVKRLLEDAVLGDTALKNFL